MSNTLSSDDIYLHDVTYLVTTLISNRPTLLAISMFLSVVAVLGVCLKKRADFLRYELFINFSSISVL